MDLREELTERYDATVRAELARPGTRAPPPGWSGLRLPAALRESVVAAAQLGDVSSLAEFYAERMPRMAVEQLFGGDDPARRLLWMSIDADRAPRLRDALLGVCAALDADGLPPEALLGARDLLAARPSAALLASRTLLGSGLPMLGAYPYEREALAAELEQGLEPHAALDLRLSGNLVHELCHGLARECSGPPAPWLVLEAAALHLGATAFPRHAHPEVPGEAVPGISLFVLAGEGLSRLFGRRALRQLLVDAADLSDVFGPRASAALRAAGWQDWLRRREPPFARDAADAIAWVKLADACRAPSPIDALLDRVAALGPLVGARELPDLLRAANAVPWSELPWWREEPSDADLAMARSAVRAMFQVDVVADGFQTRPLRPARLHLDAESCLLTRDREPGGVGPGEPPRWIVPPPLCRRLRGAGLPRLSIEGENHQQLLALVLEPGGGLTWTSSPS